MILGRQINLKTVTIICSIIFLMWFLSEIKQNYQMRQKYIRLQSYKEEINNTGDNINHVYQIANQTEILLSQLYELRFKLKRRLHKFQLHRNITKNNYNS